MSGDTEGCHLEVVGGLADLGEGDVGPDVGDRVYFFSEVVEQLWFVAGYVFEFPWFLKADCMRGMVTDELVYILDVRRDGTAVPGDDFDF